MKKPVPKSKSAAKSAAKTGGATKTAGKAKAARTERQAVTPHLICRDVVQAIAFYKSAFGALEVLRLPGKGGKIIHASIRIGPAMIMLAEEMPEWGSLSPLALDGSPVTIHLYVDDVDAFVTHAAKAGATVTMPVADMFWGDRYGKLRDPFGHHWSIATHQRDMTPDEMLVAMKAAMPGSA